MRTIVLTQQRAQNGCRNTKGIQCIAQRWPEIQWYLLIGKISGIGEAPVAASLSREVSVAREEESVIEKGDEISEDGQAAEEEEQDICNPIGTSHKRSASSREIKSKKSERKGESISTSVLETKTERTQGNGIPVFDSL